MLACGNSLFTIYCKDYFFKKGLCESLEITYVSSAANLRLNSRKKAEHQDYFQADIVVLSSKSIFEQLPVRECSHDTDSAVIVFCSKSMSEIVMGTKGYEKALFIQPGITLNELSSIFKILIFGSSQERNSLFTKTRNFALTNKEKRVSELLSKGMNQFEISAITGINPKTVSSHLRSAMMKYKVRTLLEYRVKLINMKLLTDK